MKGVKIAFAALKVPGPEELHITIALRYDVTAADMYCMQEDLNDFVKTLLPIQVSFGNFCLFGERGTIPAYKVYIEDERIKAILEKYHKKHYIESPDKSMYPRLKFHVTVDTPEKKSFFESMMRTNPRGFEVTEVLFRTKTVGADPVFTDSDWTCPDCNTVTSLLQKECSKAGCDQWRPKEVEAIVRTAIREAVTVTEAARMIGQVAEAPTGPAVPTGPPNPSRQYRTSDWFCPGCKFKIYGSKSHCSKCGIKNPVQ
jgi:hypothetical protein